MIVTFLCVSLFSETQSMHKGFDSRRRASAAFDRKYSTNLAAVPTVNAQEIPHALGIEHFDVSPEQAMEEGRSRARANSNSSLADSQKEHSEHRKTLITGIICGAGALCFAVSFIPGGKEGFCNGKQS